MSWIRSTVNSLIASFLLIALPARVMAWEPNTKALEDTIQIGNFAAYLNAGSAWLNQIRPAQPNETNLVTLLKDPVVLQTLCQRQLIFKTSAARLGAFAAASPANRAFLSWLLKNTPAMELYLEAVVPIGLEAREANNYTLNTTALEIWRKILAADPDAKSGIYQKVAIATAIAPPGSVNIGAGGAITPADPVARYKHFKTAHQNKELFPSFDHLTVWEYTKIVYSGASDADLAWAREMVNTFRPDLRTDEMVVNSTSLVWRRNSPIPFEGSFKNVLAGGGKCGPRSSWSQMVCHAFGIPAIGVSQPAHACVAYKAANPMTQPQPGSAWKVGFGRGWEVSRLEGLKGPDFLLGIAKRSDAAKFSIVEHLRWFASALSPAERAAAVMEIARAINDSIPAVRTDLAASLKPDEAEADPGVRAGQGVNPEQTSVAPALTNSSTMPIMAVGNIIHVEAAAFAQTGGQISWGGQVPHVLVHNCFTGGKQVYFQQQMKSQWVDYHIDIPKAGTYAMNMKAACINVDQVLEINSGETKLATVEIPLTYGLWQETKPIRVKLEKGIQTLRVQTPRSQNAENHKRGIALRSFDLNFE